MTLSPDDDQRAHHVDDMVRRRVGILALRRLRDMVDRQAHDEAAIRAFTLRALLWLAVIALAIPLAMFGIGAIRALAATLSQGQPIALFLARLVAEGRVMLLLAIPWAAAVYALVRLKRARRR